MTIPSSSESLLQSIERSDIRIVREMPSFFGYNEDFVFQHVVLTLILSGSARPSTTCGSSHITKTT